MNIQTFLQSLLNYSSGNFIQVIAANTNGKRGFAGLISDDVVKISKWCDLQNVKHKRDIYFTLCAYSELNKQPRAKDKHPHMWKVRRAQHTLVPRDFIFLDFDFKDQVISDWQSDPHAIADTIIAELGDPSAQVHTGGGVHLYYHLRDPAYILSAQHELLALFNAQQTEFPIMDQRAGRAMNDIARMPYLYNNKRDAEVEIIQLTDKLSYKRKIQLTKRAKFIRGNPGPKKVISNNAFSGARAPQWKDPSKVAPVRRIGEVMVSLNDVHAACGAFRQFVRDAKAGFVRPGNKIAGTHNDLLTAISIFKFSTLKTSETEVDTPAQRQQAMKVLSCHPDADMSYLEQQYDSIYYRIGCTSWGADYSDNCVNCPYRSEVVRKGKASKATPYGAAVSLKNARNAVVANKKMQGLLSKNVTMADRLKFVDIPATFFVDDTTGIFYNDGIKQSGQVSSLPFRVGRIAHPNMITVYLGPSYDEPLPLEISARQINMLENLQRYGISVVPTPDTKDTATAQNRLVTYVKMSHASCQIVPQDEQGYGWRAKGKQFLLSDRTYVMEGNTPVEKPPVPSKIEAAECYRMADGCNAIDWWGAANSLFFDLSEMRERSTAVLASFASPLYSVLLRNLESHGHIYCMIGTGNIGKSTALFAAQSVWGMADRPMISPSSTIYSVYARLSVNGCLPACYDDILRPLADSHNRVTPLAALAHFITEGRARERLTQNYSLSQDSGFSQIMIATSNASMVNRLNQETDEQIALTDRITEVHVYQMDKALKTRHGLNISRHTETHMSVMRNNAGAAGREFISYLMPRIAQYRSAFSAISDALLSRGINNRHERTFWGCILTAQQILLDMGRLHTQLFEGNDLAVSIAAYRERVRRDVRRNQITPEDIIANYHKNIYPCSLDNRRLVLDAGFTQQNMQVNEDRAIWAFEDRGQEFFVLSLPLIQSYIRSVQANIAQASLIDKWKRDGIIKEGRRALPTPNGVSVRKRILVYQRIAL